MAAAEKPQGYPNMTTLASINTTGSPAQRAQRLTLAAGAAQRRADRFKIYYKKIRATYKGMKKEAKDLRKGAKKAAKEARALQATKPKVKKKQKKVAAKAAAPKPAPAPAASAPSVPLVG